MRRNTLISLIFSAVLVLALSVAPAAMAHHKDGHEGGPKKAEEQTDDNSDESENEDDEGNKGKAKGHDKDNGSKGNGSGKKNDGTDDKGKDGDEPYTDGAPGNNGTIKIDGEPYDTSKGQEAHVGCDFRVLYWGFDEGDDLQSVLTFTAQAPTSGDFTFTDTITLGEGEPDIAGPYNLVDELIAAGIEPHAQQGWHIKLTTNTEYSQGADVKHKVFWVQDCEEPETPDTPDTPDTPEVEGEQDVDDDALDTGVEVLGEQATSTVGTQQAGPSAAVPTAVDAGLTTAQVAASTPLRGLLVALLGLLVAGTGLVLRRRA
jgi:hypothetical protein